MLIKYKVVYKVTISGQEAGYVNNKNEVENLINEKINNNEEYTIAYVDITEQPTFEPVFANRGINTNEEEIVEKVSQSAITTYKVYSIAIGKEEPIYVNSITEAEDTVTKIKEEYKEKIDNINISVNEIYTQDIKEMTNQNIEVASVVKEEINEAIKEQEKIKSATLDGIYFSTKPVSGNITSRYGSREDIRSHAHSGLDIAAPLGTKIVAAADGKVTHSSVMGGYGNLIIIDHGNGIQTYYGHCSKLYVKVGTEVKAGDEIAAVGSTGFSTGNHLHFEIRKNGSTLNPQKYLYK